MIVSRGWENRKGTTRADRTQIADYQHNLPYTTLAPILTQLYTSHSISPLPLLQLYLSSVFDHYPNLRLILAHSGSLPSLIPRVKN